jgi:hypothetical protein
MEQFSIYDGHIVQKTSEPRSSNNEVLIIFKEKRYLTCTNLRNYSSGILELNHTTLFRLSRNFWSFMRKGRVGESGVIWTGFCVLRISVLRIIRNKCFIVN